jgi:isopenicillin-N epimerase
MNFSVDLSDVDFYAGNLHKWVMGPKGTAFGWAHPQKQRLLQNVYGSWSVFECPSRMQTFAEGGQFACRMLWSHSMNFPTYFALQSCFEIWHQYGIKHIQNEILKRSHYLKNGLAKIGLNPVVQSEKFQTALLCYDLNDFSEKSFVAPNLMKSAGTKALQVGLPQVPRKKILRLTPHIHNDLEELQTTVQILQTSRK